MITVIENQVNQIIHAHATGCSHITRSQKEIASTNPFGGTAQLTTEEFGTVFEAAEFFFGETSADDYQPETPEWEQDVMDSWEMMVKVSPCVHGK